MAHPPDAANPVGAAAVDRLRGRGYKIAMAPPPYHRMQSTPGIAGR